jgi:hypothetical protein
MARQFTPQSIMAHYLIGYELGGPNVPVLEKHLANLAARRVSSCEWVLKAESGKTLDLYRTVGKDDVRGFFAQQLSEGYDWHKIVFEADALFSRLKAS